MGIVDELGEGVTILKKGDRVVMPFNVADGRCRNCDEGKTAFCTGVNPGFAGGAYGYVAMGPFRGGQAQYIRVPYADFNALLLPPGTEHEADFVLLAGQSHIPLSQIGPRTKVLTMCKRHLPNRLARSGDLWLQVRRKHCSLWRRPSWLDGCLLSPASWCISCFRGRPCPRETGSC